MDYKQFLKKKIFGTSGLAESQQNPNDPKNTFINDPIEIQKTKLREYNVWYSGDSDALLNFYTRENMIGYNTEPFYDRNKQSYFWSVSSTEGDVKRTHSGQPRNIVDTLVNIVGLPKLGCGNEKLDAVLARILRDNKFSRMFLQEQLPLTLVEGWGCWKINWDTDLSDTPILLYYRADACDFIYRYNRLAAIIFKDYYCDEAGRKYVLLETRRKGEPDIGPDGEKQPCLIIEKELFVLGTDDALTPCALTDLPQLADVEPVLKVTYYDGFLAVPCIIYEDSTSENQGRSIFTGKIDLFDDLDQCLSQAANTVRRSTAKEYFNSNYLERDPDTGMPIMPKAFDRKYVMFQGGRDASGNMGMSEPVQTTQPALNFMQYDAEATSILLQVINGILAPATLGIDIAKKDNAESQREKEKVTIFTRNTIIEEEVDILQKLGRELLCANELMNFGKITAKDYDVSVKFSEFADASYESKLEVLLTAFNADIMTPEMFIEKLYGDTLSEAEKKQQIEYIVQKQADASMGGLDPSMLGAIGGAMGGMNPYDEAMMSPETQMGYQSPTGEVPAQMEGNTRPTRDGRNL